MNEQDDCLSDYYRPHRYVEYISRECIAPKIGYLITHMMKAKHASLHTKAEVVIKNFF